LQWSIEKGRDLVVDLRAQPADLALRNAGHAHGFDQIIDRARRYSLNVGLLDHRGERLLGRAARFQKGRKITALAQLRDAQLDGPGAGLPNPVAIAVSVIDALRAALSMRGADQALDFQLHQSLRGKTDHLAQQISVRALLPQGAQAHHLIGHRRVLGSREGLATKPYRRSAMTTAVDKWPTAARLVAVAAAGHLPTAPTPPHGTRPIRHVPSLCRDYPQERESEYRPSESPSGFVSLAHLKRAKPQAGCAVMLYCGA